MYEPVQSSAGTSGDFERIEGASVGDRLNPQGAQSDNIIINPPVLAGEEMPVWGLEDHGAQQAVQTEQQVFQ